MSCRPNPRPPTICDLFQTPTPTYKLLRCGRCKLIWHCVSPSRHRVVRHLAVPTLTDLQHRVSPASTRAGQHTFGTAPSFPSRSRRLGSNGPTRSSTPKSQGSNDFACMWQGLFWYVMHVRNRIFDLKQFTKLQYRDIRIKPDLKQIGDAQRLALLSESVTITGTW